MPDARKILVVEDEAPIAKLLSTKLGLTGYEVKTAGDGQIALDLMSGEKFDLVLLDLMMPNVDGFQVLAELKKRNDATPVIVATNLNQPNDISRVMELGCTNYYVKADTSLDQIVENVRSVLAVR